VNQLSRSPMPAAPRQVWATFAAEKATDLLEGLLELSRGATGSNDASPTIQGVMTALLSVMILDPSKDDAAIADDIARMVADTLPQLRFLAIHGDTAGAA